MKIEEMIAANRADCSGCEACANICPKNAIEMVRDAEGFAYPKINPELCIRCGRCDATCPALNFQEKKASALPPTFAAIYDDDKILRHSSSGGIFSALSEIILNDGGIVFGAGYDKNWRVVHTEAKNLDELENLRSSKYVQSQIGSVYRQVRSALKSQKVLFSGTPCQCAGLKNFLGGDHENLLTVEIVCHGTPSPELWEKYIDEIGYAHSITGVNFRSKRNGWGGRGVSFIEINFSDKENIFSANSNNLYGRLFLRNLTLRPSCSACKFRFPNSAGDLSLGDAWGILDFAPELFDERGLSVVFVLSDKGKNFFDRANLKSTQIKFVDAVRKNKLFVSPTMADSRRENFFNDLAKTDDWVAVLQKYSAQDDTEFRKATGKKNSAAFQKSLREILAPLRQKFAQNLLVVSSLRERAEQKNLESFFEQNTQNCGLYFLQPKDAFVCAENFSGSRTDLKDAAALTNFVKQYNIGGVCVEKPLNFGDGFSAIVEWLKTCGLPVKLFAPKK